MLNASLFPTWLAEKHGCWSALAIIRLSATVIHKGQAMARGINKVILVGTLGKDPEVRYSQAGAAMTSVSVATNESWKDKQTGEKQERTEWHRVKFFGRLAEIAGEYLKKGGQVYIEGSLRTDKYTDKQGIERYSTDIIASEMQMLGGSPGGGERSGGGDRPQRSAGGERDSGARSGGASSAPGSRSDEPFPDDDIPF
jgi:single-strand DNA-binding protein